ncbi:hypothetical protein W97_06382 [Coniosporium apollinis CBS 100218]|uniref:Major facilitator superfamily (MFS) profile domain-containing protein n=1 Tax=Coniosporium apollinis (strain CBS 100218) TaxID=1168221 RepID=R7YZD4_CONA1|nr:uncharacterized protein W97_06382 [Coniosporium apollinis CBS 100218]EON67129.1 hypothetical protein W97_06382 [Coniosporium apollinis CBS 100218]
MEGLPAQRQPKGAYATTAQPTLHPPTIYSEPTGSSSEVDDKGEPTKAYVLQPADEGFGAWSYVASAFTMFIVVWGFPQAFPIFQTYLAAGKNAKHRDSLLLGLLAPGLQDILEGILFQVLPRSPRYRRTIVVFGILAITAAMFFASIADTVWQIVLSQGVLFGVGGIMLNFVHVSIFSEWFEQKKSKAMAVIWLGWRVGSLAFPIVCQWLLDKHGYEKTLRVLIAPMLALLAPTIVLFRGRYRTATISSQPMAPRVSKRTALRARKIWYNLFVSSLFYFVTNVPTMFIAAFASDLKLSTSDQAIALSLRALGDMPGMYLFGWLGNSGSYQALMALCALSTSLVHCLVWGFVKTRFGLFAYALVFGLANGGYTNCMMPFFAEIAGSDGALFTVVHSLFSFLRGFAILSVGPVGVHLLRLGGEVVTESYAIGKYKYLVAYASGMTFASGALTLFSIHFWKPPK